MSKIIESKEVTEGTNYITKNREYHVYEEDNKVYVEAILNEGENSETLGFVPECNDRYIFGEYNTYEEAIKEIEKE